MISTTPPQRLLTRSDSERLLAGVCGGLAEHLRVPVMAVRITMLLLVLAGGAGVLLYLWLWVTVPLRAADSPVAPMRRALTRPSDGSADHYGAAGADPATAVQAGRGTGPGAGADPGTAEQAGRGTGAGAGAGAAASSGGAAGGEATTESVSATDASPASEPQGAPGAAQAFGQRAATAPGPGLGTDPGLAAAPAAQARAQLPAQAPAQAPGHTRAPTHTQAPAQAAARALAQAPAQATAPSPAQGRATRTAAEAPGAAIHTPAPGSQRAQWPVAELLLGTCLLVVGVLLVVQQLGVELRLSIILPGLAVLVGVGLTWWQIADRKRPEANQVPRVLGALSLVAVGVLMFFVTAESPNIWTVMAAALAALAGVALAIAPWLLRLNRELIAERAGREREAERSEIAAHLHDSVLQTLALIQQRSAPGSEVSRIARGQERELREWLFRAADGGSAAPKETALEELRAHAAALEDAHPVRFETVGVGAEVVVPEPIVAAAKEAMLNAAQHAGGEVTVFAEVTPARVSIDVTDRGPGLDPEHLPEGRMGVRDSILGRMSRAGGTAKIVRGPGGTGTSVRLEMPREQRPDAKPEPEQKPEQQHEQQPNQKREPADDAGAGVSP